MVTPPTNPERPLFGAFYGHINPETAGRFVANFMGATLLPEKFTHFHIFFQSNGGSVGDGIAMHDFLKRSPVEVTLYNPGNVASIATIAYLGAKNRIVSPYALFMIHRTTTTLERQGVEKVRAATKTLAMDDDRTAAILRHSITFTNKAWNELRKHEHWLTADDAIACGLATGVGHWSPPKGVALLTF